MEATQEFEALKAQVAALAGRVQELEDNERRSLSWVEVDSNFERLVKEIDRRSLERVIRDTSIEDWGAAIVGLSLDQVAKVRDCVSGNAWKLLKDTAQLKHIFSHGQRESILRTVRQLEEMGLIVLTAAATQLSHEVSEVGSDSAPWPSEATEAQNAIYEREKEEKRRWFAEVLPVVDSMPRQRAKDQEHEIAV
jgi:hypothetical protein